MKNYILSIIVIFLIGACKYSGTSENRILEQDSVVEYRYNEVLSQIELENVLNPQKNEQLYSIATEIHGNYKLILETIKENDTPIDDKIYSSIRAINNIQLEHLGKKRFESSIIIKSAGILADRLRNYTRQDVINLILSDNFYFLNTMLYNGRENDITFNSFQPIVLEETNEVSLGGIYTSNVYLAAFDTIQNFIVSFENDDSVYIDQNGSVAFYFKTDKKGVHKYRGEIKVKKNDGYVLTLPFQEDFFVK